MRYEDYLKPKRILMTADTVGGVWTFALELARALAQDEIEIALATMGPPLKKNQREEANGISNLQVYEGQYKLEWMDDPWDDVADSGIWLLHLEEQLCPDIVHLNGYAHGSMPWRSPTLVVGHSCVLSWWDAVHKEQAPSSWDRYYLEIARGLAAADVVVAPSKEMFWELNKNYGPIHCGRVIYNGRDPNRFRPSDKKDEIIFTAGRLNDYAKNMRLVNAIAERLPWPIYAAGILSESPPQGCAESNKSVCTLGYLPEPKLAEWYGRSSIFVLPAKYEPFGLCILEAALSECALILGDIPTLREIWQDAAIYVKPDDPDDLEEKIMSLIARPELRQEMGALARKHASLYTPRNMADGYMAVYQELAEGWHTSGNLFKPQTAAMYNVFKENMSPNDQL
jgi:glycosyltransferase involved in cell wall biosynthesis